MSLCWWVPGDALAPGILHPCPVLRLLIPPFWRGLEVLRYFGSSIACSNMLMGFPTALGWAELSVKHLSVSHLQLVTNDLKLLIFCAVTQTRRGSLVIMP